MRILVTSSRMPFALDMVRKLAERGHEVWAALLEPGEEVQLDLAVFGQMFSQSPRELPRSINDLAQVRGAGQGWRDLMPTMYSFLAFAQSAKMSIAERKQLFVAMSDGITWDGQPIAGISDSDAAVLKELTGEPTSS